MKTLSDWWNNKMAKRRKRPKPTPMPPAPPAPTVPVPPVARFTVTGEGLTRTLDASESTGIIVRYEWDLGKEPDRYASGMIVSVTYPHGGDRTVVLTVTDDNGLTNSSPQTFAVTEPVVEPPPLPTGPTGPPPVPPVPTGPTAPPPLPTGPTAPPPPPPVPPTTGADVTIEVDTSQRFQEMRGFGTSQRTLEDPHLINQPLWNDPPLAIPDDKRAELMDVLYTDAALSRIRIHIEAAGLDPLNTAGAWGEYPMRYVEEAKARGLREWWTSFGADRVGTATPETFAAYCLGVMRFWRDRGHEFPYFSILNEPSNHVSVAWYLEAFRLVTQQARAEEYTCKFVVADDVNPVAAAAIARAVLEHSEASQYAAVLATHLYYDPANFWRLGELAAIAEQNGLPLWMSEFSTMATGGDAFSYGVLMHQLLTEYNASALDYMWGFFGDFDRAQLISLQSSGAEYRGYTKRDEFYVVRQFSKYIRPGAVRVAATSSNPGVLASAYELNGKRVIVALNTGTATLTVGAPWGATYILSPQTVTALTEV